MTLKTVLLIDRDGIINHLVHYQHGWDSPQKPQDIKLIRGIEKIIAWANKNNVLVVEISNQPGVAKGKMTKKTSDTIENVIHKLLKDMNTHIDYSYICNHHPNGVVPNLTKECICRKPKPGLILQAAREQHIDLKKSIFLGDKESDVLAGKNAGCKTLIYLHTHDLPDKVEKAKNAEADYKINRLSDALPVLRKNFEVK
jgi:D-glycero-D-manno-heptose 1,7-bisphosphate phosphatase